MQNTSHHLLTITKNVHYCLQLFFNQLNDAPHKRKFLSDGLRAKIQMIIQYRAGRGVASVDSSMCSRAAGGKLTIVILNNALS